ncbi:hypothetical protein BHM03_00037141 [Ensete ventricosum]|nr:hypothetical protein BHM03_00037141 [Ensete ventricosum]
MEISFERAETSDIPTKPSSLDLQSIYVKKSRSSDRKSWAGKEVLVLEQESRVFNTKLGSAFEEGGEFLSESTRKPSRKEASLSSLEPGSKRQRNSLNVSRPKQNYISYAQRRDNTTNTSDAAFNLDWSSGNEHYLEADLYSQLSKKTDHTSSSSGTSKNENYLGEDLFIPKRPRGIFKWKKAKDPISLGIPVGNSNHEWINTHTQDQNSSISVNLNSSVLNDKQKTEADDFELNEFSKDDSAPCTSVENDSHFEDDDRKVGSRRKLKMSEQNCTGNVGPLIDNSEDSVGDSLDDDEENLEENAARMLSSRFDPNCTGFSGKRTCAADQVEGSSFLQSAGGRLKVLQSESCSVDAKGRVLRPRRHNGKSFARKRRHFYEVCSRDMDPYCVIKQRIRVFWPLDKSWYFGLVKGYDPVTRLHHVKYDDRDEEWINLQKERFKLLLFPSEVSSKFKFGKPGSQVRQKKIGKKVEATQSTYKGNLLESEPIISWLARTTRRVTSSSPSTIKKHLRVPPLKDIRPSVLSEPRENMSVNPLDKNLNKLFSNFNESDQACDWNINRLSKLKRSIDCEGRKLPYVYFRKRFRSRKDILDTEVVHNVAPDGPESVWLCQSLYILHHGQLVCAWPTVHMELLFVKDPSTFCSEDYISVSSQKHTDDNDKLTADGCCSAEDPSKQDAETLDNSGPFLSQAAESHGRPSTDALSSENDGNLNGSTENFFTSEVNVIQNAVDGSGNGVKSTCDAGVIQFGRFSCKAGTSQFAEVSCSECPEGSSPAKSLDGGCNSCINTANLKAQLFDEVEKHSLHKGLLIAHPASNLVLEMNEHTIHNPTAPRSMWHRNRHTSLSRTFIHPPKFGSEDLVANGATSRCRRRRTQVSYSQLSVGYEHSAKPQNNHQKMGTEVDLALDPSRVLYDVDSEDEEWIHTMRVTMDTMDSKIPEVTEDMFEKVIDMFEKLAYTLQSEEFTNDDIERYMADVGPADIIKVIYKYWRLKRKKQVVQYFVNPQGFETTISSRTKAQQSQCTGLQTHHTDKDEFRLRDATTAAQHASNMARLKREKAQWLLHKADLALHRATVAIVTAEAIKASEKDTVGDG